MHPNRHKRSYSFVSQTSLWILVVRKWLEQDFNRLCFWFFSLLVSGIRDGLDKWPRCAYVPSRFNRVQLFATPRTINHQALLFMGFSRQEYWSGLPFPSPGDLPNPGMPLRPPALQADSLPSELPFGWWIWGWNTTEVMCSSQGILSHSWWSWPPSLG